MAGVWRDLEHFVGFLEENKVGSGGEDGWVVQVCPWMQVNRKGFSY